MLMREVYKTHKEALQRLQCLEKQLLKNLYRRVVYHNEKEIEVYSYSKDFSLLHSIIRYNNEKYELIYEI